ncbi:hypothetical protein M218_19285 [Burkholderia pseudomallei MSHR338]|uniref:Uncharacterized protein n=2 Tax=pseudomallei group TaxID=111527 RepID=A2RY96_BURM9|nr:hypothetical protein BMA10229_0851 [Burkholderia mallei NCTC 10229]ABN86589.1 hypothetical protein BURPS668_A1135 [Burkholderia pseudomallei 668]ABN94896.1 hypothetical protein BURPS1106A_A1050 [Burkholderia pseudomallei 1106a]ABO03220.1 hypothetical protein BMA10247_A1816 [Burkholderia mallei NCTC 10247]EBA49344.1 hypothetical protein BURPS305_5371 [Burkholderia pseudomallei 305]EDK52035.1 hypothetical protein BMAFMH_I0078 [Burkholderia mallei FMH]EDK57339.1 hypothetical protein BMAJHU_F0
MPIPLPIRSPAGAHGAAVHPLRRMRSRGAPPRMHAHASAYACASKHVFAV